MLGFLSQPFGPARFSSPDAFAEWLRYFSSSEAVASHIRLYGKPIVRVSADRQIPNEADL